MRQLSHRDIITAVITDTVKPAPYKYLQILKSIKGHEDRCPSKCHNEMHPINVPFSSGNYPCTFLRSSIITMVENPHVVEQEIENVNDRSDCCLGASWDLNHTYGMILIAAQKSWTCIPASCQNKPQLNVALLCERLANLQRHGAQHSLRSGNGYVALVAGMHPMNDTSSPDWSTVLYVPVALHWVWQVSSFLWLVSLNIY